MKIEVIGAQGQIGAELVSAAAFLGWETQALDHSQAEVQDKSGSEEALASFGPDYVLNTATYYNVVECETSPSLAESVNDFGSRNLAELEKDPTARTVCFSRDYVFDHGLEFGQAYRPTDAAEPLKVYGSFKLPGERSRLGVYGDNLGVRISSVFGIHRPKNSVLDISGTSDCFESQDWRVAVKRCLAEKGAA